MKRFTVKPKNKVMASSMPTDEELYTLSDDELSSKYPYLYTRDTDRLVADMSICCRSFIDELQGLLRDPAKINAASDENLAFLVDSIADLQSALYDRGLFNNRF